MTGLTGQAATESVYAIGLDVGGTKIAGGLISPNGEIIERASAPTPSTERGTTTLEIVSTIIDRFRERYPHIQAVGVGAAGMIDWPSGHIRWAPNNSYRELPLKKLLSERTGLPTIVDNDANVAAWAETLIGAGVGYRHLAVLTVGTGIGAGLILDGRIYRGSSGIGGEFGHIIVNAGGPRCGCGSAGCLEAMASGTALGRIGRDAALKDPGGMLATLANGASNVTGETVFEAAQLGDPTARSLFEQVGYWLGIGIASLVTLLDIEVVVLGGGLATTGVLLMEPVCSSFQRFLFAKNRRKAPPIFFARLGGDAGMVGAGLLALGQTASDRPPEATVSAQA